MRHASVGIDPGLKGGIALYHSDGQMVRSLVPLGKGLGISARCLYEQLKNWNEFFSLTVAVEKVHSMPQQGVVSTFTFGLGYGKILAVLEVLQLPHKLISPQMWKKEILIGTAKDKAAAIEYCQRSYPNMDIVGPKFTDGMADALCIACYDWRKGG